ncbi:c-type cytochrome domain-containing protein [uncultured Winogradskyella sp.]|uniref:c-type cytochrome domain-containing protein n=1 Tax=uncultured Winogradskyella sp. TaxID=395353 RepID=UPI00261AEAF8|nr:c-type cytochrome domain-containing protein [uncultured Winogradskyella sp.]
MKHIDKLYKNTFLIVIFVFGVITLYTIKTEEVPRFILFLGRFHPLVLHLPIGALVVTFFLEIIRRFQKNEVSETIKHLLGFTAIFSVITCFFGYFLSLEGGYADRTLDLHFYSGTATAIFTSILLYLTTRSDFKSSKIFLPFFVLTLILISVAGHFGSVLTHGDNFLTEYAGVKPKTKTIEVVDSLKIYEDVVFKILDSKCIQCHNASKQKGELSMLTPDLILKGGVSGASLVSGNPDKSSLLTRMLLPVSNEEHMPPEGKEQPTKDEIWLIKHWIENGANFSDYASQVASNDTLRDKLKKYLVFNTIEIPKAPADDIEMVRNSGFRVFEIVPGEAALNVKLLDKNPAKEAIMLLEAVEEQIVELDFFNADVTDEMLKVVKQMKNLKFLRVNNESITDAFLKHLKDLEQLEVLNLYNTSITDKGLSELLTNIRPQKIYTNSTEVTDEKALTLKEEYDVSIQNSIQKGFVEDSQLEMPLVSPIKTLFKDTIHVAVKSRIKDVDLRYTLDGTVPDSTSKKLDEILIFEASTTLKVIASKKGWVSSEVLVKDFAKIVHDVNAYSVLKKPSENYASADKLFDLQEGTLDFRDGNWTGYFGEDLVSTIDLGEEKNVDNISFSCLEDVNTWILYPKEFTVYASNSKNTRFKKVGNANVTREGQGGDAELKKVHLNFNDVSARYFKVVIKNHGKLPDWHAAAGNPSWLFVDEIYFW